MKYRKLWWLTLTFALIAAAAFAAPTVVQTDAKASAPTVLVIDAGHGGADGGAVAPDGTKESDLNLDIALHLESLACFWGLDTRMTRTDDTIDYPPAAQTLSEMKKADQKARVDLINNTEGAVLVSIHQNNYPAEAPNGIQVFYGAEENSIELAKTMQENLTTQLLPGNRRVAEPINEDIYLMRKVSCPAVLVECGFLSNPEDLENLENTDYRMELAVVILASCLQHIRGSTI